MYLEGPGYLWTRVDRSLYTCTGTRSRSNRPSLPKGTAACGNVPRSAQVCKTRPRLYPRKAPAHSCQHMLLHTYALAPTQAIREKCTCTHTSSIQTAPLPSFLPSFPFSLPALTTVFLMGSPAPVQARKLPPPTPACFYRSIKHTRGHFPLKKKNTRVRGALHPR